MANTPLTADELQAIKDGHAAGKSLRAIASDLGRSASTVGRYAREAGLSFDGSRTATATQAKQAGNRDRRARLVGRLYDRADRIMDRLDAPTFRYVGLDKNGKAVVTDLPADAVPGTEERALFGMVMNALNTAAKMEQVDAGQTDNAEAKGILGALSESLHAAYGQLAHTGGTPTADALERELEVDP